MAISIITFRINGTRHCTPSPDFSNATDKHRDLFLPSYISVGICQILGRRLKLASSAASRSVELASRICQNA